MGHSHLKVTITELGLRQMNPRVIVGWIGFQCRVENRDRVAQNSRSGSRTGGTFNRRRFRQFEFFRSQGAPVDCLDPRQ